MSQPPENKLDDVPEPKPMVLELRNVTYAGRSEDGIQLDNASLQLRESDLVVVRLSPGRKCRDVASMMVGLQQPSHGEVLFQQTSWQTGHFEQHFRRRGRIGRVFEDQAWIENLNVSENIELARLHHGASAAEIEDEIRDWTRRFQVPCFTRDRPAFVDSAVLQIYQWVRALLGNPALLILERPTKFVAASQRSALIESIDELRIGGTAVVWFTSAAEDLGHRPAAPRTDMELSDGALREYVGAGA
jgi:ABC-type ATPase involved in cell division